MMIFPLIAALIIAVACGVVYPLVMIGFYKIKYGKRVTLRWILKEIGW